MDIEIKIIKDEHAFKLLTDTNFISKWQELADKNQKITVHQEPPFATTWYRIYANKFLPILILGYDNKSELVGLIPLTLSIEGQRLTHAGAWQAEYKGWLCKKEAEPHFPKQALITIKDHFQLKKWDWGWVSPESDIDWLASEALKKEKIYVKIIEEDSPLLNLKDDALLERLKKSRSIKTKMNRFQKRDNFHIERITSKERATKIFDILEKQCDFRQMAINHVTPFRSDPNKKPFHVERLDFPKDNHFAVLWSNNHPVAFNYGECDSKMVLLGVTSYDPLDGRNSPGVIFILKLAELLKEEGFHYFDLSPGGNEYKQTFCNATQKVYKVTFIFGTKDHIIFDLKSSLKKAVKGTLSITGLKSTLIKHHLVNTLKEFKSHAKKSQRKLFKAPYSVATKKEVVLYYRFATESLTIDSSINGPPIDFNNYSDLFLYDESNQLHEKTELISTALKRFNTQEQLYTIVKDGELVQYGWVTSQIDPKDNMPFELPQNSMVIYDLFTHPAYNKQDFLDKTIRSMLINCYEQGVKEVFFKASENDTTIRNIIESIGFKVHS